VNGFPCLVSRRLQTDGRDKFLVGMTFNSPLAQGELDSIRPARAGTRLSSNEP